MYKFLNVGKSSLIFFFFFFRILSIFNTHIRGEGRRFFKETYNCVYPKKKNTIIDRKNDDMDMDDDAAQQEHNNI